MADTSVMILHIHPKQLCETNDDKRLLGGPIKFELAFKELIGNNLMRSERTLCLVKSAYSSESACYTDMSGQSLCCFLYKYFRAHRLHCRDS